MNNFTVFSCVVSNAECRNDVGVVILGVIMPSVTIPSVLAPSRTYYLDLFSLLISLAFLIIDRMQRKKLTNFG
jgi:hypothetical protein